MDRSYEIRLILDGQIMQQHWSPGSNALEAFELAADQNMIHIPNGLVCDIVAINHETGLSIKFEAGRAE